MADKHSDVLALGVLFALNAYAGSVAYFGYQRKKHEASALANTPVFERASDIQQAYKSIKNDQIPYVFVRGQVQPLGKDVIRSSSGAVGVAQHFHVVQHVKARRNDGGIAYTESPAHDTKKVVPFGLVEYDDPAFKSLKLPAKLVKVNDPSEEYLHVGTKVIDRYDKSNGPSTPGETPGSAVIIASQKTETILPVGTLITIGGQLTRDAAGLVSIGRPGPNPDFTPFIVSLASPREIVKSMDAGKDLLYAIACTCGGLGVLLAGTIIYRFWMKYRRNLKDDD